MEAPRRTNPGNRLALLLLENTPFLLLASVFAVFSIWNPAFLGWSNITNIAVQSSSAAIVAIGMTFVLLTGGIDLSVGAVMFVTAGVLAKMVLGGWPLAAALAAIIAIGAAWGALNAFFIVRLRVLAFIVTLGTLYFGRGLGLWITETRAMNLPESVTRLGSERVLGVPFPIVAFLCLLAAAHVLLTRTPFGRQVYAVGQDAEAAKKAGVRVGRILVSVYVICGLCAAAGGIVSLAQLGSVSPTFGKGREFDAIAAAVLGGTSLFGGRGNVFPGAVIGALLIQTISSGLVMVDADVYVFPIATAAVIFLAVLVDSFRSSRLLELGRRKIRVESPA
jgi:ribose transport system permease protein